MPNSPKYLYWDTCVFLDYLKQKPERWPTLSALFTEIEQSNRTRKIVTSMITRVEVVYIEFNEGTGFSPDEERRLDDFWSDYSVIAFIEVDEEVTRLARGLMRHAKQQGWKLRFADAIHLASAQWLEQFAPNDLVFHTNDLQDFQKFSGIVPFQICEPSVEQLPLLP